MGDMLGSGIFFTPGQVASVAQFEWQVYSIWLLCGVITLCGALTLAEIATLLPRSGASYHALGAAFGPRIAFIQAWTMVLVSGPGAIAGAAILFGELAARMTDTGAAWMWGAAVIVFFCAINVAGVAWGGRTQIILTSIKVLGLFALVVGALALAEAVLPTPVAVVGTSDDGIGSLVRVVGLGIGFVLFTYDGWIDASNVAGEVRDPNRAFPLAMGLGVVGVTLIYLIVNFAFLRIMPLAEMRHDPSMVAATVAEAAFGATGGSVLDVFIWVSIGGSLGGLILTLPRLYYAAAHEYVDRANRRGVGAMFRVLSYVSPRTSAPSGAIVMGGAIAILALISFGSFSSIVSFFVVPFQIVNILMVAAVFRLRPRLATRDTYRTPLYPLVPWFFIAVMSVFVIATLIYNPVESLIGCALALLGIPVFNLLNRDDSR